MLPLRPDQLYAKGEKASMKYFYLFPPLRQRWQKLSAVVLAHMCKSRRGFRRVQPDYGLLSVRHESL